MNKNKIYTAIGMMSGTSLDGIDIALIRTDGHRAVERLDFTTFPYEDEAKAAVRACFGKTSRDSAVEKAEALITEAHIRAVKAFGHEAELIGFHGQTIHHDPDQHFTWQIGDAAALARATGMQVIGDLRVADVKAGGQGAPLLPLYHQALAENLPRPLAVLNLGGVGNVTWLGEGDEDILAFDTGPANAQLDDFVSRKAGKPYDEDGRFAQAGHVDEDMLARWMTHPYFAQRPPKSLDRNAWAVDEDVDKLSIQDGASTLTAFTVRSVLKATEHFSAPPARWLVTGGGRKNKMFMIGLAAGLGVSVEPVEAAGWNGDAMEAEGFAYLAVRSLLGLPVTVPGTTGVEMPLTGGVLHAA